MLSYGVTDTFPNAEVAGYRRTGMDLDEEDPDGWYQLDETEQWNAAMLQLVEDQGLRIGPDTLAARFGQGISAFDLNRVMAQLPEQETRGGAT